ncbi:hypothetical protein J4709_27820 [Actinomadura sp. LCR2-06]|uniref:Semialdehyde dehydrogenase dimerisation domain-containing protein n=1 Tax=Actinomadura violacea TaxID=2819934 RepID=A0ABS3RZF6_9ACTN|nr:hypothetical protein [Actinomadura violacea]
MIVPEVNPDLVRDRPRGVLAGPGCTTLSMIVALGALHARYGLRELVVASCQAASGAGREGAGTLYAQLEKVGDDGWCSEELGIRDECREVLGLPELKAAATCVRVPVVTAHSVAVHAVFAARVDRREAQDVLARSPGVVLCDNPEMLEFPAPSDAAGTDPTWAGRVRRSPDDPRALDLFLCGDNLRKGAALNTAQIAEPVAADLTP